MTQHSAGRGDTIAHLVNEPERVREGEAKAGGGAGEAGAKDAASFTQVEKTGATA